MTDEADLAHPADGPQRITVGVDLLPGPLTEAVAERMLQIVVEELLRIGAEVTAVRIEVHGSMAAW